MTIATLDPALKPRDFNVELRNAARSGGVSLSGAEQRVSSGAARWEVTARFPIHNTAQVNAWRAMVARLRMGEDIDLNVFDLHKPGNFGGDTGTLAADAPIRSVSLSLTGSGLAIEPGSHFSIGARLHLVTEVLAEEGVNVGLVLAVSGSANWNDAEVWTDDQAFALTVKIVPPTRAAYLDGQEVQFDDLKVRCILKDLNDGDIGLELGRWGTPTITFVESLL